MTQDRWKCQSTDGEDGLPYLADKGNADVLCAQAENERVAGVRCCYDTPAGVTAEDTCEYKCERLTFEAAENRCTTINARMCTEAEALLTVTTNPHQCGYRRMYVWVSDTCDVVTIPAELTIP